MLMKSDRVAVAFFGDGASNNGCFHEAINLATAWQLPVLFVCENNQYATEIAFKSISRSPSVGARAAGYGLPGFTIDGNDVQEVYRVAGEAVERARSGCGPTLIECQTYRVRAHSEGMRDAGYRTPEEVAEWRTRCPIKRFREVALSTGLLSESELMEVDAEIAELVKEAAEFAERSPWPELSSISAHVLSGEEVARG
jgi:2-oxoisovalerate dehydrogenase E1 component